MNQSMIVLRLVSLLALIVFIIGGLILLTTPIVIKSTAIWVILTVVVGTGWIIWHQRNKVEDFLVTASNLSSYQPWRGLAIGLVLTGIYALVLWLLYGVWSPWMVSSMGVSHRSSLFSVTMAGLISLPAIWYLYDSTGIPGQVESIAKARRIILPAILSFFAWWYINQPTTLFDHQTGEVKFWVADKEEKIYYSPGFSTVTGEKLRPGTSEDAEKYKKKPLAESLSEGMDSIMTETSAAEVKAEHGVFQLEIPPAPEWSRPLRKEDIPSSKESAISSPRREYRYRRGDSNSMIANDINPPNFSGTSWIGLQFQSTSSESEILTFTR